MKNLSRFTKKEIKQFFSSARATYKSPELTILVRQKTDSHARILIVASRKVGNAPQRNKLKRQLRAIFYEEKLFQGNLDCAVLLRKKAQELLFKQLKEILVHHVT
ncbi:ribonuclease P protein component [Candidatus Dependentiae bacterium]|nr:ribonuclease P protein component [Candidatus Dependentiae bacterium]